MMKEKEAWTIVKNLEPDDNMLEWGSGFSTNFFSRFVSSYHSVEHTKEWYDWVKHLAIHNEKVHLYFVNLSLSPEVQKERPSRGIYYKEYIDSVDNLNITFSKVLIDGRVRPQCALKILSYLDNSKNPKVFLHDWNPRSKRRHYYDIVKIFYNVIEFEEYLTVLEPKPKKDLPGFPSLPEWW